MHDSSVPTSPPIRVNPLTWLLDRLGSIWFGVTMLVLIFLYSSIGSALPPIRQGDLADWTGLEFLRFEKTEMEWFSWWPFRVMITLFCLAMVTVTLRRIRFTVVNAGVWAVHTGIVITAISAAIYFGSKVEGDTVIFQSRARIRAPGASEATMVIRPEAGITVGSGEHQYTIQVTQLVPEYMIRTGQDEGKHTQQVWLAVSAPHPLNLPGLKQPTNTFIRTMLVGYPDYTEDVVPGPDGPMRAVKATGQKLLDRDLQISLEYDPVQYFYHSHAPPVRSTGAIYVRFSPDQEWTELRVHDLPHYHEHVSHYDELWLTAGEAFPPVRPLNLPAQKPANASTLTNLEFRVTDYVPYGDLEMRFAEGDDSDPLNPLVRFTLQSGGRFETRELMFRDPQSRQLELTSDFKAELAWVSTPQERARLLAPADPRSATAQLLIIAGPDNPSVDIVLALHDGYRQHRQVGVREAFALAEDVNMTIDAVLQRARQEVRPAIVPKAHRASLSNVGKSASLVRVEINDGQRIASIWLPFNEYVFPDSQRAEPSRFRYAPRALRLADGRVLWLMYSRWREALPSPVALDRFVLQTHPGGDTPSDYISRVAFETPTGWSNIAEVRSNHPVQHGDLWYFQSQWDPGTEAYTVLGVGNRRGVRGMLAGVITSIAGMIYAFYVKPAVIRRRKQAAVAAAAARVREAATARAVVPARVDRIPTRASRQSETTPV